MVKNKSKISRQENVQTGRNRQLEEMANRLLWEAYQQESESSTEDRSEQSPHVVEHETGCECESLRSSQSQRPTKKAWANQFGLPYRWNQPDVISLDGLLELSDNSSSSGYNAPPTFHQLGTVASPPTKRRHIGEAQLEEHSRDKTATKELLKKRSELYNDLADARDDTNDSSNLRRKIRDISSALYDLCGNDSIPNADPLTWDTSFYERVPLDLVVAPIADILELDYDPTLGIYTSSYNFAELCGAIASGELVEWWETRDEQQQKQLLKSYWSYHTEIEVAGAEHRLVDLRDFEQVDRILNQGQFAQETPIWNILWIGAKRALSPIQWMVFEMKLNYRSNKDIREEVNSSFGTTYRENYISTIWHKQIPVAIGEIFRQLEAEIQSLAEPELWKRCKSCGRKKLATTDNFVKRKQCGDGLAGICKECEKIRREEKKEIIKFNKQRGMV